MLTHKSKKSIHNKKSKKLGKPKSLKDKSMKNLSKTKSLKDNIKKKGCWSSSSCSSSSSSCWSSSSCSYSSSSCSNSCWSGCSSSSYKSCSVSSHGCSSSSSSDGSCDNEKHKTLTLGNKYLNIGNDTLTLRFDPSKCNSLSAPTYQMGFGLANIVSGTSSNNVLLLGLNETTAPYVNVTPRTSGGNYIAPYVSIDFPSVSGTSNVIDDNSNSTISNKQLKFVGNDPWTTSTDIFNLSTTITGLGLHTVGRYANISNTIILGPENINYSCSVYSATNNTLTADFRNLVINVYNFTDTNIDVTNALTGYPMLAHGDVRYLNLINSSSTSANITFTIGPSVQTIISGNIYRPPISTAFVVADKTAKQIKLTTTYVNAVNAYYITLQE